MHFPEDSESRYAIYLNSCVNCGPDLQLQFLNFLQGDQACGGSAVQHTVNRVFIVGHRQDGGFINVDFSDVDKSDINLKVGNIDW